MRNYNIRAQMVDEDTEGFSTGISTKTKTYNQNELNNRKYLELIEGIDVIDGCVWQFDI